MSRLESTLERACRDRAKALGGMLLKLRDLRGFPDRLLLLPGSRLAFVEFKREGSVPSLLQGYRIDQLKALGFNAKYVDSTDGFKGLLEEMGE